MICFFLMKETEWKFAVSAPEPRLFRAAAWLGGIRRQYGNSEVRAIQT